MFHGAKSPIQSLLLLLHLNSNELLYPNITIYVMTYEYCSPSYYNKIDFEMFQRKFDD